MAGRRRVDDDEVEAAFVVQLVQLLHRHVLLRADERTRRRCGRSGSRGCARPARRRSALRAHERVERRLRVEHQRREAAARRAPFRRRVPARCGRSRCGVSGRRSSPSVSASRFAGSIVTTHALRPRRARLEREHGRTSSSCRRRRCRSTRRRGRRRRARRSSRLGLRQRLDPARSSASASASTSPGPISGVNRNGRRICGSGSRSASRSTCSLLDARGARARNAAACASRAPRRSRRTGRRRRRPRRPRAPTAPRGRGRRSTALTTTGPERDARPGPRARTRCRSTSFTGVSSGSVTSMTWQRAGSASSSTTSSACLRIGPDPHRVEQPPRRQRNVIAWPAAGASTTMRSATLGAPRAA